MLIRRFFWLITKNNPSKIYPDAVWRLPKGWIDNKSRNVPGPMASGKIRADEKSLREAALREVAEEGGVNAKIIVKIDTAVYFLNLPKGRIIKFVTYYLMEWLKDLPEGHDDETSEVAWLPFEEAKKTLSYAHEKQILKKANELLADLFH